MTGATMNLYQMRSQPLSGTEKRKKSLFLVFEIVFNITWRYAA